MDKVSILTIVGWIVAFLIAIVGWIIAANYTIKQVKLAHHHNKELNEALLKQNAKANLVKELLSRFSDISISTKRMLMAISRCYANMAIAVHEKNKLDIDWLTIIDPIEQGYDGVCEAFARYETWLSSAEYYIDNRENLRAIYTDFRKHFALTGDYSDMKSNIWLELECLLIRMKKNRFPDVDGFQQKALSIVQYFNSLDRSMKEEAKEAQSILFSPTL